MTSLSPTTETKPRPSLRLLQIFEAAVVGRSVGSAALKVGITQPAATESLRRLEALIGVSLLKRGRHGCHPSECGSILHARVRRLFEQMELALSEPLIGSPFADGRRVPILARSITESHIRAVAAIDESGSIERAAQVLGISPPAVQRAARGLEGLLRRPLFTRTAYGISTTRSGAELARRLQVALRELDDALDEIEMSRGIGSARLLLGVLPMACTPILAAALDSLAREYPGVNIQVNEAVYQTLVPQLRSGRIDFVFGILRHAQRAEDVVEMPLFHDPLVVVARRSHPLAQRERIALDDLIGYEWVVPPVTSTRRQHIDDLFADQGRSPRVAVETNSLATAKSILAISDRLTLLSRHEAEQEADSGQLDTLPFPHAINREPAGLAMRRDWQPTAVQKRFIALAKLHAGAYFTGAADDRALAAQ